MTPLPSSSPSSLLLLPSPPQPPTPKAIHAAYHAPLSAAISRLSSSSSSSSPSPRLTVAIVSTFQRSSWPQLQSLLARLYSLVAAVLPEDDTADVRIVLVDHVPGRDYPGSSSPYSPDPSSTIPDLSGLAGQQSSQQWSEILHPDSEAAYSLLKAFLTVAEDAHRVTYLHKQLVSVPGGITLTTSPASQLSDDTPSSQRYKTVCLGGTFDHLHPGHKLLLHAAVLLLSLPRQLDSSDPAIFIIGISGDALLKNKKFATELEPWPARTASVLSYLCSIMPASQIPSDTGPVPDNEEIRAHFFDGRLVVRCVNIPDGYGPTITEEDIGAIVLSGETRSGGASINDKRGEKGWKKLDVYEIDVLQPYKEEEEEGEGVDGARDPEDFSAKISSTEIRRRRAEARES